ncbi:MAG TPA: zinc-binding dehydrogenase, partial [Candidatus Methylomirabilis sp.]|nr:zinc-binding dehydrogenase [Candidatus Methylomirabilis sp.]
MRQVWITSHGAPDRLAVRESPDPTPTGNELRVRVKASGVNFADILARKGLYPDAPKPPLVVGYEVSGSVDASGPDASRQWVGKDVFGLVRFGGYADCVVIPEAQAFEKPASLSHEQCAAIPVQYLTAWQLLVVMGSLSSTETVLIHNAGGGVGLAAIDIARHVGATIFGTASPGKHAFLKSRGLHEAIDYRRRDWSEEVARLTGGRGVELIIDPLGGRHWKKSLKALRHTGRLGMFGVSTATESRLPGPLRLLGLGLGMPLFNP